MMLAWIEDIPVVVGYRCYRISSTNRKECLFDVDSIVAMMWIVYIKKVAYIVAQDSCSL
jgi:hypothetical protein